MLAIQTLHQTYNIDMYGTRTLQRPIGDTILGCALRMATRAHT